MECAMRSELNSVAYTPSELNEAIHTQAAQRAMLSELRGLLNEAHIAIAMVRDNETAMQALRPIEQAHIRKMWQELAEALFGGYAK